MCDHQSNNNDVITGVKIKSPEDFYDDAKKYWENISPTVDGMLGGFGFISDLDIQGSKKFLQQLYKRDNPPGFEHALDCGAGIGRISKNLLLPMFNTIDMVEQNPKFIEESRHYLTKSLNNVSKQYVIGLQDFTPEENRYDLIWCQWVLGHLTDDDFIKFFQRCKKGLKQNGIIVVKENVASTNEVDVDEIDSSVTRPLWLMVSLFESANVKIIRSVRQSNFPKGLYGVNMFALVPNDETVHNTEPTQAETTKQQIAAPSLDEKNPCDLSVNIALHLDNSLTL